MRKKWYKRPVCFIPAILGLIIFVILMVSDFGGGVPAPVKTVQQGYMGNYKSMNLKEAFNGFFADPEWTAIKGEDGLTYVNFKGKGYYWDELAEYVIQFQINPEDSRFFEATAIEVEGEPITLLAVWELLEAMYNPE